MQIDWGDDRFVRLEPVVDKKEHPGSMQDPISGKLYTVQAVLCEADGTLVDTIAEWGWIDAEFAEGVIYNAEGNETWMIMRDINCPAIPTFSTPLTSTRTIDHGDVMSGLGIRSYELQNMYEPIRYSERAGKIYEGENAGITYRFPPEAPGLRLSRTINEIHRAPLFRHRFRFGDIVSCKVKPSEGGVELELADNLVCHYHDRFDSPSFHMEGEEVLFWGPRNDYTVVLSVRQAPNGKEFTRDDVYGSDASFEIALELYDSRDRYVQTIAAVPSVDFVADGWMVLEHEGIALRLRDRDYRSGNARPDGRPNDRPGDRPGNRHGGPERIKLSCERLPATISALQKSTEFIK